LPFNQNDNWNGIDITNFVKRNILVPSHV